MSWVLFFLSFSHVFVSYIKKSLPSPGLLELTFVLLCFGRVSLGSYIGMTAHGVLLRDGVFMAGITAPRKIVDGHWDGAEWERDCLACTRPWLQSPAQIVRKNVLVESRYLVPLQ